jgi:hypothetical protein
MNAKRLFRWLRYLALGLVLLIVLVAARALYTFRDRSPGYSLSLNVSPAAAAAKPRPLRVGFARFKINPDLSDTNRPVWLAGFSQNRSATAQHDDLWAMACVVDDGYTRLGIVALDAIGFFHDDVIAVRRALAPDLKLDYAVICSTHNHSTPDLMGLWGPNILRTGVDPAYRRQVITAAVLTLTEATTRLQPTRLALLEIPTPPAGLVTDTRKPQVFDPDIRVMLFLNATNDATLGSVVGWANHPETPWSKNREITSDFCGYLRDALADGVVVDGKQLAQGVGGTHLFVNGAIGGLITTSPGTAVRDPVSGEELQKPSHEKARALGLQLAMRILPRLAEARASATNHAPIGIRARTLEMPLANKAFVAAAVLGLMDRGHSSWMKLRTEVALLTVGEASLACIPGEIYPELVNGGIERAPGGDFDIEPLEVPPLRALMPGRVKFLLGLANDEIGYIIPKSEWDQKPPYIYGSERGVYGEINSVGPETAGLLHRAFKEMCARDHLAITRSGE